MELQPALGACTRDAHHTMMVLEVSFGYMVKLQGLFVMPSLVGPAHLAGSRLRGRCTMIHPFGSGRQAQPPLATLHSHLDTLLCICRRVACHCILLANPQHPILSPDSPDSVLLRPGASNSHSDTVTMCPSAPLTCTQLHQPCTCMTYSLQGMCSSGSVAGCITAGQNLRWSCNLQ